LYRINSNVKAVRKSWH